ncbi:MAG: alkaline phosphatase PhoX [Gammaproteobacteria bacterium]
MKRRQFLQAGLCVAGAFTLGRDFWKQAYAAPAVAGASPYGPLIGPDANGLFLPRGFSSRLIATAHEPVPLLNGGLSSYVWHRAPDGGAVIPQEDGGWIYVSNSEIPIVADEFFSTGTTEQGGVGAIRFDAQGNVVDAYPILQGTNNNCAGGLTPWGTWLSCEENFFGFVYECDPTGLNPPLRLAAMGQFGHEAAAVDPVGKAIYMTEDTGDGAFYRFRPAVWPDGGRPDLTAGVLEVAVVGDNPPVRRVHEAEIRAVLAQLPGVDYDDIPWEQIMPGVEETAPGPVRWEIVHNPAGLPLGTRYQVPTAAIFRGGEGCWYDSGLVYFTCKGSNRVWTYDTVQQTVDILYDASQIGPDAPLTGVDNLVVHPHSRDVLVAEDGGNMELVLITADRVAAPFLRYPVPHSELAGPAFDASGTRLYFASQAKRHRVDEATGQVIRGQIFEITGPFRQTPANPVGDDPAAAPLAPPPRSAGALGAVSLAALAAAAAWQVVAPDKPQDR